jgi:hypothetical protein
MPEFSSFAPIIWSISIGVVCFIVGVFSTQKAIRDGKVKGYTVVDPQHRGAGAGDGIFVARTNSSGMPYIAYDTSMVYYNPQRDRFEAIPQTRIISAESIREDLRRSNVDIQQSVLAYLTGIFSVVSSSGRDSGAVRVVSSRGRPTPPIDIPLTWSTDPPVEEPVPQKVKRVSSLNAPKRKIDL